MDLEDFETVTEFDNEVFDEAALDEAELDDATDPFAESGSELREPGGSSVTS